MLQLLLSIGFAAAVWSFPAPVQAIENSKCYNKCQFRHQGRPKKIPKCIYKCEMKRSNLIPRN